MPAAQSTRSCRAASAQAIGALILGVAPEKLPGKITGGEAQRVVVGSNGGWPTWTNIESAHGQCRKRITSYMQVRTRVRWDRCVSPSASRPPRPRKRRQCRAHGGIRGLAGPLADDLGRGDNRSASLHQSFTCCHGGEVRAVRAAIKEDVDVITIDERIERNGKNFVLEPKASKDQTGAISRGECLHERFMRPWRPMLQQAEPELRWHA